MSLFLPGVTLDLPGLPTLTEFQFEMDFDANNYQMSVNLNLPWENTDKAEILKKEALGK